MKGNSAFSEQAYRRYFPASCLSTLGSWIVRFLLGWSAWELTHSAFWVGVTAALMVIMTTDRRVTRVEGGVLLAGYCLYIAVVVGGVAG